ncbi:LamB/YcsF family protein [Gluconobacter kondonii]|uniref:5-oxoprolinase subunit A n=2 Tax=Gluconobacter TaxID=441 RepID=A0A7X1VNU4_9PROT|nr:MULTISPECIES: 5-oxoprolinase subunit PxpA [Gluconobacter]MBF0889658.1 LamB/YcsF family protein [Gluconobacter cadivus]MBS1061201.1 LamB/YcsF family protein [Gluconobacter sp. Dm-44]MBS1073960.1 LamB/YcsF family protein [Gluconobacter sp. Dm-73]MBS1078410.1 LamB/YcsF family protein [Gluconobacter kondonii]MBS1092717.1 LamB/YcsF family protein [Gluconobacter sp. Dm-74]
MTAKTIDLNADLGESFGHYTMGNDSAMLDIVTSANVACGFHGGDPEVMAETFRIAREKGVSVGSHPGFPDLWGFGRRVMPFTPAQIERIVAYQMGAAQALATYSGHRMTYMKTHGALGNLTERDPAVAEAIVNAVKAVDPNLPIMAIALSHLDRIGRERGLTVFSEIFADRAYTEDGHLVSRKEPGAVLHDADFAAARAVRMVQAGAIETISGKMLPTRIDTICVHGDNAESVDVARKVRAGFEAAGITLRALT